MATIDTWPVPGRDANGNPQGTKAADYDARLQAERQGQKDRLDARIGKPGVVGPSALVPRRPGG